MAHKKQHGVALLAHQAKAKAKKAKPKKAKAKKHHHHHAKRSAAKRPAKKATKKRGRKACPQCGHRAEHGKSGCTHFAGGNFCSCKHR